MIRIIFIKISKPKPRIYNSNHILRIILIFRFSASSTFPRSPFPISH